MNLEILICTIDDNINRVGQMLMAPDPQILYLVSWQRTDACTIDEIPSALRRDDVRVVTLAGRGLSRNRNNAIRNAIGDICLIADDDLCYDVNNVKRIIRKFSEDSNLDIGAFKYASSSHSKYYPDYSFNLYQFPRFYYPSSIEIAFRRKRVQTQLAFNELMGLGASILNSGEEEIFLHDAKRANMKCRFFPIEIVRHDSLTTGYNKEKDKETIMSRGVVLKARYSNSYMLQILISAIREKVKKGVPFFYSLKYLFRGVRYAKKNHIC